MITGYDDAFQWDPEDKRLREDGMGEDGQRLNPGDILEDGTEWYIGWPGPRAEEADPSPDAPPDA